ncbi:MAG: ATP-binding protein [Desulfatiglandales bacterium]
MDENPVIRVLLIEDDEDDYILVRDMLRDISGGKYQLQWVTCFEDTLHNLHVPESDVCLLDYRLGGQSGIQILRGLQEAGYEAPVIILTGQGDHEVDMMAMQQGAADYLDKGYLTPVLLERAVRYAIERARNLKALKVSESHLKYLSRKLVDAQEKERKAIARELHDSIGSNLTAIKYALEDRCFRMENDLDPSDDGISFREIIDIVKETIEETRRIQSDLRPSILDDFGLIAAVQGACRKAGHVYSHIRIETNIDLEEKDIPEGLKIALFRILQEALNNTVKHSRASCLEFSLTKLNNKLELMIRDDGQGFEIMHCESPGEGSGSGLGLSTMEERAELTGGILEIDSQRGRGTTVRATWPLPGE